MDNIPDNSSIPLSESRTFRLLYVSNKGGTSAGESDYRLMYPRVSKLCSIVYALPEKPLSVGNEHYVQMHFGEGFRLSYLFEFLKLGMYLHENRYKIDFVHFYSTLLILFGPIVARVASVTSIITITGLGRVFSNTNLVYKVLQRAYLLLFGIVVHITSRVLFQNHSDFTFLAKKFPNAAHKFIYIGSGTSLPIVRSKNFTMPRLKVLLVARIMVEKGIKDFLDVAKRLSDRKSFDFILIGPGSNGNEDLLELVKRYHSTGIITYCGELSYTDTIEEFEQAHIFFFPSFYGEGVARVLLESGFFQLCPIAYDMTFNADLISNKRGFLVQKGDINAVTKILSILEKKRDLLERHARAYQEHITNQYDIGVFAARMDKALIDLACEKGIG